MEEYKPLSSVEMPTYRSPDEFGMAEYKDYFQFVKMYNRALKHYVRDKIDRQNDIEYPFALLMTGSDGRYEKDPQSLMDTILVLGSDGRRQKTANRLKDMLASEKKDGKEIFRQPEIKRIGKNSMMYYTDGKIDNREAIYPTRMMDSRMVAGDRHMYYDALHNLYMELMSDVEGKRVKDRVKDKRMEYKRITERGWGNIGGRNVEHFDAENGFIYCNPSEGQFSTKYGPLRLVQFRLAQDMITHLREGCCESMIFDVPKNIEERINYLQTTGQSNLTSDGARDLIDNYQYFTLVYHMSQNRYNNLGDTTIALGGDERNDFQGRLLDTINLTKTPIIKKRAKVHSISSKSG